MSMEEESAFGIRAPTSDSRARNDSPQARALREPISAYCMDDHERRAHAAQGEIADRSTTAELPAHMGDAMVRIAVHDARPIEHLPVIASSELKMIGCCVSFRVKATKKGRLGTSYHYTGLVAAVTATTVTLMHANRYTSDDIKGYKCREELLKKNEDAFSDSDSCLITNKLGALFLEEMRRTTHLREPASDNGAFFYGFPEKGAVIFAQHRGCTGTNRRPALHELLVSGSLAPAVGLVTEDELDSIASGWRQEAHEPTSETSAAAAHREGSRSSPRAVRHRRFRTFDGSFGPIPYVTFLRKSIHEVEFGRDPRSSFYSLFQDPAKHIGDMQHLRMFVRRYLVHTSEGNNPRQVPLYAYLSARCAWPSVDRELVSRLVHEELVGLLKTDRAIEEEKKRTRIREQQRVQAVRQYRAPSGLFSSTGILYLTSIPQSSFWAGVVVLFFNLLFGGCLGLLLGLSLDAIVVSFVIKLRGLFIASLTVWTMSGVAIIAHAVAVHVPLYDNIARIVVRIALTLASIGCCIITILVLTSNLQDDALYGLMVDHQEGHLCSFYERHLCTGFLTSCESEKNYSHLCSWCPSMPVTGTSCYASLRSQVRIVSSPLLVLSCCILATTLYAAYLVVKLLLFVEAVMGRVA
ncbi:hypothetical protein LSCM1_01378 [Leishmania martiniquensis]|uniref:Uncharacterized protein n=1 Tax=Leishmania martiniquensis TaxID=1580590 RepID=A0A836GAI6_9TRYP|nr:hypothetical protein LSCM1_01378 [Leishmania martiniquensis]